MISVSMLTTQNCGTYLFWLVSGSRALIPITDLNFVLPSFCVSEFDIVLCFILPYVVIFG